MLTVVVKEVGRAAEIRNIETDDVLETCQKLVNGYVQCGGIGPGVSIVCNEDGLALNLPDNCGYVGNLVFVQDHLISEEEGYDWGSLDEDNQRKALCWCAKYSGLPHPNRDGGFTMITGDKEIEEYHKKLALDAHSKLMDWESL